jgi:predicted Zn-dependent protease
MDRILELEALVLADPGDSAFAELADIYRRSGDYGGALDLCYNGLSANPECHLGRVVLARVFYERLQFPFAIRELRELAVLDPKNIFVSKLLSMLAPSGEPYISSPDSVSRPMAEAEFSFEDLSAIDLFEKDS